jgi:hypothetical protein
MRRPLAAATAALSLTAFGLQAQAATFTWGFDAPTVGGDTTAGSYDALRITYDEGEDGIAASPTLDIRGTVQLNEAVGIVGGGWFAISPGGDPRATTEELAIFYMDFESGLVSAYRYDGTLGINGIDTYRNQDLFITAFEDAVEATITGGVLTFEIDGLDLSEVQMASMAEGYTGAAFGEEIGLWLHLAVLTAFETDDQGRLTAFGTSALASFDLPRAPTDGVDVIPLPGAAVFALTGLAGVFGLRKLRKQA